MKVPKEITSTVEAPVIVLPPEKLPEPPKVGDKNVAPTTTAAEDKIKEGQQRVHLIWETTQALIAVAVTAAVIYAAAKGTESLLLGNAFTLIIAIYFVRLNHSNKAETGTKDYSGR